jgi:hypothetical protein
MLILAGGAGSERSIVRGRGRGRQAQNGKRRQHRLCRRAAATFAGVCLDRCRFFRQRAVPRPRDGARAPPCLGTQRKAGKMRRMCALWAVGCWLGLVAAAPAQQPVTPAACTSCPGGCASDKACAPCAAKTCAAPCRESCWSKFCNWCCYRALPVPCECVGHHCASCQCAPHVPLFFVRSCGTCGGCGYGGCGYGGCSAGSCATGGCAAGNCSTGCSGCVGGCCSGCGLSHR